MSWNWGFLRGGAYRLPAFVQCKIALAFMCVCRKVFVCAFAVGVWPGLRLGQSYISCRCTTFDRHNATLVTVHMHKYTDTHFHVF